MKKESNLEQSQQQDKHFVAVADKIFRILGYVAYHGARQQPLAFREISKALPFPRTTVHRLLYSLERLKFVERADTKAHYRLGPSFFELTEPAVEFRRLQSLARAVMLNLQVRTSETVNLGVLDKGQVTYIEVLQSPNALRIAGNVGDRNPVHSTALGKAILAYLPERELESILDPHPLVKMTPKTITRKASLLENLATVRKRGAAIDLEENLAGVICVAAPIFDHRRKAVAALSLSGPTSRMRPKLKILQNEIRAASVELSRMLQPGSTMPADRQS